MGNRTNKHLNATSTQAIVEAGTASAPDRQHRRCDHPRPAAGHVGTGSEVMQRICCVDGGRQINCSTALDVRGARCLSHDPAPPGIFAQLCLIT